VAQEPRVPSRARLGLNRDQMNEAFFLGLGVPGSTAPAETVALSPGRRTAPSGRPTTHGKPTRSWINSACASGTAKGNACGPSGTGRLRIGLLTIGQQQFTYTQFAEMVAQHWKAIGIAADANEAERSLAFTKLAIGEHHLFVWTIGGSENLLSLPRYVLPVDPADSPLGMPFARWYASNGAQGKKPTDAELLRAMDLFRAAAGKREAERIQIGKEIWKILVEECWVIGTVGQFPPP